MIFDNPRILIEILTEIEGVLYNVVIVIMCYYNVILHVMHFNMGIQATLI